MSQKKIICLDFDDCIFPGYTILPNWNSAELSLEQLEINLKKIKLFLEYEKASIFITSSWSKLFEFKDSNIFLNEKAKEYFSSQKDDNFYLLNAFSLMKSYLDGKVIGISKGNRIKEIIELSLDKNNMIIVFDDWDLKETETDNVKTYSVLGSVNNNILWDAHRFLNKK